LRDKSVEGRRCYENKQKKIKGFTQKYNVDKLIYFERFDSIDSAIAREKQIKGFSGEKNWYSLIRLIMIGKNYHIQDYSRILCKFI